MSDPRYRRAESNGDPGNLKLRSFREGDVRVIALANNFDGSTMKEVERELNGAEGTDAQVIVLDLRILEFIDSGRLKVVVITDGRHLATDTHD
jgi:anti-anti-sigma regulatory factor